MSSGGQWHPDLGATATRGLPFECVSPDLKIAGNSIFILLSTNFSSVIETRLPNFRMSQGVPVLSSPAFWGAAGVGKIGTTV